MNYCDILFLIDPNLSCELLFTGLRNLHDYCDVSINWNDLIIDYDEDGVAKISLCGEMPDSKEYWDRLVQDIQDIDGIKIDYDGMREWLL